MKDMRNAYQILIRKPKGTARDPRRLREDNITIDLKQIECKGVNWSKNKKFWEELIASFP
jgi:hypothetical protein